MIAARTTLRAVSAQAFVASLPRSFWISRMSSALFIFVFYWLLEEIYAGYILVVENREARRPIPLYQRCAPIRPNRCFALLFNAQVRFFRGTVNKNIEIFLRPAARKSFPRKGRIAIRPQTPRATYEICARKPELTIQASEPPFQAAPFPRSSSPRPPPKPRARAPRTCRRARRKCAPRKTAEFRPRRLPCARSLCRR